MKAERLDHLVTSVTLKGQSFTTAAPVLAISPDGTQMAYSATNRLYLRSMSELEARPIPGSETAQTLVNPVFSPDGRSIAFWSDRALKRIAVSGGVVVTICPADAVYGMSWGTDAIVFGQGTKNRRHRLLVLGRVTAVKWVDVGVGLTMNSGSPYSETLGGDIYNNGRGVARSPGVARNSLQTSGYSSLDLRASRDVKVRGVGQAARTFTFAVDAFNVLNQVNYGSFVGTLGSPLFGQPVSAQAPRQLQFSARVKF